MIRQNKNFCRGSAVIKNKYSCMGCSKTNQTEQEGRAALHGGSLSGLRIGQEAGLVILEQVVMLDRPDEALMMHMDLCRDTQQGWSGQNSQPASSLLQLLHPVEGAACTEPLNLRLVESVVQEDGLLGPVGVLDDAVQRLQ